MQNKIKISFVIPVYNAEFTIKDTVNSILMQDNHEIEIILVNDGSTDNSSKICDEIYENNNNVVKVIHQNNEGSLSARLKGSSIASGSYLFYVDADDIILDGAIDHIFVDIKSESDLYIYDYIMDNVGGNDFKTIQILSKSNLTKFEFIDKKEIYKSFMSGMMNTVCATGIKRDCFTKISKINFPEYIKNGEDRLQKLFLLLNANSITYVPYAFYHYRWINGSQGQNLREGNFSKEIFDNFKKTWTIERIFYKDLGFSVTEATIYDSRKLTQICGLLENSYNKNRIDKKKFNSMLNYISNDDLFIQISNKNILKRVRLHIKLTSFFLLKHLNNFVLIYWSLCNILRNFKKNIYDNS